MIRIDTREIRTERLVTMFSWRVRLMVVLGCVLGSCWVGVSSGSAASPSRFGVTERTGSSDYGAGQTDASAGLAVNNDPSSLYYGDVYVAGGRSAKRVDRFSGAGAFQLAWGSGIANGADELQTCSTFCQKGPTENLSGGGLLDEPSGIAVDSNEPLDSASSGDVYVQDGGNNRIQKYGPSGEFILVFGRDVNETTGGNVCTGEEVQTKAVKCKAGTVGTANGQFDQLPNENFGTKDPSLGHTLAVGPHGLVYVGDLSPRIQVFESNGVWKETISLSKLSTSGHPTALAVDVSGDVFVADSGTAGVHEFGPGGVEKPVEFDAGSTTVASLAVDGTGNVFVGDSNNSNTGFRIFKYAPTGKISDVFGANTVRGGEQYLWDESRDVLDFSNGMAFSQASNTVYATENFISELQRGEDRIVANSVWGIPVPPPGPLIGSESAVAGPRISLDFEASLNPEGNETTYHFEYVTQAAFEASGYSGALSTASFTLPAGIEERSVHVSVSALSPDTIYHYRLVASNSEGTATGTDQTVTTYPPALVESLYTTDVSASGATITAVINPLGAPTEYSIEYGTGGSYDHVLKGGLGEGVHGVQVVHRVQGLGPSTVYDYRVSTSSEVGDLTGEGHVCTTQRVGELHGLPDGRAWELVSPPDKKGSLIAPFEEGIIQAAAAGNGISYLSREAIGEGVAGKADKPDQILSMRVSPGSWRSQDITLPHLLAGEGQEASEMYDFKHEYWLFSSDLSYGMIDAEGIVPPLAPGVTERTLYLRDNQNGSYVPLVSPANVPEGVQYGGSATKNEGEEQLHLAAATPDMSSVILSSPIPLTPEATTIKCVLTHNCSGLLPINLYEWTAGRLKLVDVLPEAEGGEPLQLGTGPYESAFLGRGRDNLIGSAYGQSLEAHSLSSDGRWVVWETILQGGALDRYDVSPAHLYVRDMVAEKTYRVGGSNPAFQMISTDGSSVFYLEGGELYVYDTATQSSLDLTSGHGVSEPSASVQSNLLGVSNNGSVSYFVAKGVLAPGAVGGQYNLYEAFRENGSWSTRLIATLSNDDNPTGSPTKVAAVEYCRHVNRKLPNHRCWAGTRPACPVVAGMWSLCLIGSLLVMIIVML